MERSRKDVPVAVQGIDDAVMVSAGYEHACAVHATGHISCWGTNSQGRLGDGTVRSSAILVLVNIDNAVSVNQMTCALLADSTVKCWGYNFIGQRNSSNENSLIPVTVTGIDNATQIAAGAAHACARLVDGTVKCWGYNVNGQLGNGDRVNSNRPVLAVGVNGATAVFAGSLV